MKCSYRRVVLSLAALLVMMVMMMCVTNRAVGNLVRLNPMASLSLVSAAASSQRPVELGEEPALGPVEDSRLDTPSEALPETRQTRPRRRDVYRGYVFNPFRDRVNVTVQ